MHLLRPLRNDAQDFRCAVSPEVVHTPDGAALLRNFTHNIAGCRGNWTMAAFREKAIADIRAQVGDGA